MYHTRFEGWQSDKEYLMWEEEQKRKDKATIERLMAKPRPLKRARLWQLGMLCLLLVILFGYKALRMLGLP